MPVVPRLRGRTLTALILARLRPMRGERGSASVEFAVTSIVYFMTMVGMMKMCLAVYTYHFVSEAAHEGSRYAIVHGNASGSAVANSDIQTYLQNQAYPGITTSLITTTTSWDTYPTSGGTCSPSATCNNPGNIVTVKVSYAFPLSIPWMANKTLTMTSTSAMVIAQ